MALLNQQQQQQQQQRQFFNSLDLHCNERLQVRLRDVVPDCGMMTKYSGTRKEMISDSATTTTTTTSSSSTDVTLLLQIIQPYLIDTLTDLKSEIELNQLKFGKFKNFKIGQFRAFFDKDTETWNRARITAMIDEDNFEVDLIDYGCRKVIAKNTCYLLPEKFRYISPQYFYGILRNVSVKDSGVLLDLHKNRIFDCQIQSKCLEQSAVIGKYDVNLFYDDPKGEQKNLSENFNPFDSREESQNLHKNSKSLPIKFTRFGIIDDETVDGKATPPSMQQKSDLNVLCLNYSEDSDSQYSIEGIDENKDTNHSHTGNTDSIFDTSYLHQKPYNMFRLFSMPPKEGEAAFGTVQISHIDSADQVFLVLNNSCADQVYTLPKTRDFISNLFDGGSLPNRPQGLEAGDWCIFVEANRKIYRGVVEFIIDEGVYRVRDLDSGLTFPVFDSNIFEYPSELWNVPPHCLLVEIANSHTIKNIKLDYDFLNNEIVNKKIFSFNHDGHVAHNNCLTGSLITAEGVDLMSILQEHSI